MSMTHMSRVQGKWLLRVNWRLSWSIYIQIWNIWGMFKNEGSNESNLIFRIVYNFLPESVALLDTLYEYIDSSPKNYMIIRWTIVLETNAFCKFISIAFYFILITAFILFSIGNNVPWLREVFVWPKGENGHSIVSGCLICIKKEFKSFFVFIVYL